MRVEGVGCRLAHEVQQPRVLARRAVHLLPHQQLQRIIFIERVSSDRKLKAQPANPRTASVRLIDVCIKDHRLVYHSTLGWRVIKKKKKKESTEGLATSKVPGDLIITMV